MPYRESKTNEINKGSKKGVELMFYRKVGAKKEYYIKTNVKKYLIILFGEKQINKVKADIKYFPIKKQIIIQFRKGK